MSRFQRATRKKARLRMALDGPAGSGKSYTALRFAFALAAAAREAGGEGRVAAIDTENESLSLYDGDAPDGVPFEFATTKLSTHAPTEYTSAIEDAGRDGFDVLIIDSLSHAWVGKDGALELKDRAGGNSFTAWRDITPMHTRMVDAILQSPCHVIATMRSKTEYVLEVNEKGKQEPRRVGTAPVQRAGMEYEFTVYGSLDLSNIMTVTKSRCSAVNKMVVVRPGAAFMRPVIDWLNTGRATAEGPRVTLATAEQVARIVSLITASGRSMGGARREQLLRYGVADVQDLRPDQADDLIRRLERLGGAGKRPAPPTTAGVPAEPPAPRPEPNDPAAGGGVTEAQMRRLNELAHELEQHGLTRQQFRNALAKRGAAKMAELTEAAAAELIQSMGARLTAAEMAAQMAADEEKIERGEPVESGVEKRERESAIAARAAPPPAPAPPPPPLPGKSEWPAQLLPLVQAHGVEAVWQASLDALGYPPLLVTDGGELKRLAAALEGGR